MAHSIDKTIEINAPKEKVWDVLLGDDTYPVWTKPFAEGSDAEHEPGWPADSDVKFGDGTGNGMISRVAEHVPNETITFEHLGQIIDGKEDLDSEEVQKWKGATERYDVTDEDGVTTLKIHLSAVEEEWGDMDGMWDKALVIVKELAEKA